jgi:EmrB/QacA subfamily drug resistance transporter
LYGRRRLYLIGVAVFLVGSVLSGAATSMLQLIASRLLQGLGAGAIIPLSMTIIGELYTIKERPRTQALFSGVWGLASVAGPLVGGYITDAWHWRWVFLLNVPFGALCMAVIASAYPASHNTKPVRVDWLGAALLFAGVSSLLLALGDDTGPFALWALLTVVLLGGFAVVERRVAEPILPVDMLRNPLVARSVSVVFLVGIALFGAIAFIPLFVQAVMGGTATEAGQVLTPLFMGWVIMSVVGARTSLKLGYKRVAVAGSVAMTLGFIGLAMLEADSTTTLLFPACFVIGSGMGFQMLSLLLAVQHGVDRSQLGIATSLTQFSRSIGAAVGVAAMGALLSRGLSGVTLPGGASAMAAGTMAMSGPLRVQFAAALHQVFVAGALVSAAGLVATFFLPHVDFGHGVTEGSGERMIEAEMATLAAQDEPVSVGD